MYIHPFFPGGIYYNTLKGKGVNFLLHRSLAHESHLRRLIRKIVKEEIARLLEEEQAKHEKTTAEDSASSIISAAGSNPPEQEITPPRFADGFQTGTWAIFGAPEPDPEKPFAINREEPRALPGFPELYRPDFTGFDAPPYLPRRPQPVRIVENFPQET
jgi:hypothetical protein